MNGAVHMTDWPQLFSEAKRQSVFLRCAGIFWGCGYGLYAFGRLAGQHRRHLPGTAGAGVGAAEGNKAAPGRCTDSKWLHYGEKPD